MLQDGPRAPPLLLPSAAGRVTRKALRDLTLLGCDLAVGAAPAKFQRNSAGAQAPCPEISPAWRPINRAR